MYNDAGFDYYATVEFLKRENLRSAETEELQNIWMSNETFLPPKTLHLNELNYLSGVLLTQVTEHASSHYSTEDGMMHVGLGDGLNSCEEHVRSHPFCFVTLSQKSIWSSSK